MDFETEIRKLWREIERLQLSDKLIVASTRSSLIERYADRPELRLVPEGEEMRAV